MKQFKSSDGSYKINVEELIKDFRVSNIDNFKMYLKEIWKDLSMRSEDKTKGINKITFYKYYDIPGIISDRLFKVFDKENKKYLGLKDFAEGMITLFTESYEKLIKFIFNFYDFEKCGKITKEDIRVVLSYIPLSISSKNSSKIVKIDFNDRVESQDEIFIILEKCFQNEPFLNFASFTNTVENKCSDIFLFVCLFFNIERKPFSINNLNEYHCKLTTPNSTSIKKYITSPSLVSKFWPSLVISKSPFMIKKSVTLNAGKSEKKNVLLQYLKNDKSKPNQNPEKTEEENKISARSQSTLNIKVRRKKKISLKNIDDPISNKDINIYDLTNFDLLPAIKCTQSNKLFINSLNIENTDNERTNDITIEENMKKTIDNNDIKSEDKFEGFLYKINEKNLIKKLYFKLVNKDLYYYKNQDDKTHKGMHNLSGVYIKEENHIKKNKLKLLGFSIIFPNQMRFYYADNEKDFKTWISIIRKVTGYSNLNSIYTLKDKLGAGRSSVVRLGIHNESGNKVAIKILQKSKMSLRDLELVQTEIEILKICQHPYIINLHEIFENYMFIYIIMEYCSGGDLFSYIEMNNFKISEEKTAQIIHKLSTAIFYLHSYGIAHRDIKPENILLTDTSDNFDIKLVDFGLSKITGPNEVCEEPFGTLSYVAPEVLLKQPYNKKVDIWSIGIITYLLLTGFLPFDDEFSDNIINMTIYNPVPYPPILWNKNSKESKNLVNSLLQKDHSQRMTIKEVLEHNWIQKYSKSNLTQMRRKSVNGCDFKVFSTIEI